MENQKKSKRVFLMGWNNSRPAFVRAALELKNRGYEILYWVVPDREAIANLKKDFKNTQFHAHDDAINFIPPPEINEADFTPPGEDLVKNFYELESTLLTMKKFCYSSRSALEKKHLFHRLIQYWYGVIDKFKPEIIFFVIWPHSVYDYTVYFLAKVLNIRTIMFEYSGVADRYLLATDFKLGSVALREEYQKNQQQRFSLENLSSDIQAYLKWHLDNRTGQVLPDLKIALKSHSGVNRLKIKFKVFFKSLKSLSFFPRLAAYFYRKIGPNLKKEYQNLQAVPDFSKKYVYLPINYQPEASSSPLGGVFVDQLLMIKIVSRCLPDDWLIYVKEHPMQWTLSNLAYSDFRYQGYYKEISQIKNVKLVPVEINSHELISNSRAICTINGTAGAEALLRLKPALLFGHIAYRDCPGAFLVKNAAACSMALKEIQAGFKVDQQQLINYFYSLDKASYHLNLENSIKKYSSVTEEEVFKTIIQVLAGEAEKTE